MQHPVTKILILSTVLIWIAFDIYIFLTQGNASTESATLYRWSYYAPGVSFLCGVLIGHLFFSQTGVIEEIKSEHITLVEKK